MVESELIDWLDKPLNELTASQWESLCDGCGKCCMAKLQDELTETLYYTNVACKLFDANTCRCTDYSHRTKKVPDCISLSLQRPHEFAWLPPTCAYRLRFNLKPLPEWHPLLSGDPNSVYDANVSVRNKTVQYDKAGPLEHHIVDWL